MFSTLRTSMVAAAVCLTALLAVPAACLIVFVATGAYHGDFPHRRSVGPERATCATSPTIHCVMPLP